uniref:Transmembrane protein n=1 Tax=Glossina pallidipes TaxID=7398 RepID=A0A1A9Z8E4_GLOPL
MITQLPTIQMYSVTQNFQNCRKQIREMIINIGIAPALGLSNKTSSCSTRKDHHNHHHQQQRCYNMINIFLVIVSVFNEVVVTFLVIVVIIVVAVDVAVAVINISFGICGTRQILKIAIANRQMDDYNG